MSSLISLTIFLLWTTECSTVTLTASTTLLSRNGTKDFYLNCSTDDHPENQSQNEMVEIRSMRISKLESSRWRPVIEIDPAWKAPKVLDNLKSSFLMGVKGPTSLGVSWDLASNVTAGQYVCDVIGYTQNGQGAWQRSSPLFVDVETHLTLYELLEMIQSSNRKLGTALKSIDIYKEKIQQIELNETKLHNTVGENFEKIWTNIQTIKETVNQNSLDTVGLLEEHEKDLDTVRTDVELIKENTKQSRLDASGPLGKHDKHFKSFRTEIETVNETLNQLKEGFDACRQLMFLDYSHWPKGTYALLMPETGCPANDGIEWKTGWIKHHTQSGGQNLDNVSKPANMKKPIIDRSESSRDNFMTQHHCSVIEPSTGREWPAGSYCVMRYKELQCPMGFMSEIIWWDDENRNNKNEYSGVHAATDIIYADGWTGIYYCCRNDSSPFTPIHLPRSKAFYLYRFNGRCQLVHGMTVTPEFMFFDTEEYTNNDKRFYIPDGTRGITDVKLELCYYEQMS